MKLRPSFPLVIVGSLALAAAAQAQSTAFTYQGHLKNGASVASGLHDFRFRLWDAASAGAQVGTTQCTDNILVSEGLFTTTIDFGQQFVTPSARFLEIEVRSDTGLTCASAAGFVVLAPRQLLTATPLASNAKHANAAFSLDAADGSPTAAVFVDNNGKVGIGTTTPGVPLHIASDTEAVMVLQDPGPASTQAGYVSFWNGTPTETAWVGFGTPGSPHFSVVNARSGGNIALLPFAGNVGIGTTAPTAKLEVHGDIRLGTSGQFRAAAGEENLRMLRGTIGTTGNVIRGSGFTAIEQSPAKYLITYNVPFPSTPSVTATSFHIGGDARRFMMILSSSSTSALIAGYHPNDGTSLSSQFDFTVIGPR
jgi:hypothetical protein